MMIIGDLFLPERSGKMQRLFGAVFGLSSVIRPAVGGFIVDNLVWQWIFYINLPFGVLAAVFIALSLKLSLKKPKSAEKKAIDWSGVARTLFFIFCFIIFKSR